MLLIWFGAITAAARRSRHYGDRITGGTFSRGRWRTIQEEKARLRREAAERKRRKREREQKERDRIAAFEAGLLAAAAKHEQELARIGSWAGLYGANADGVGAGAESIMAQAQLAALLSQSSQRLVDEREERELMEALFAA